MDDSYTRRVVERRQRREQAQRVRVIVAASVLTGAAAVAAVLWIQRKSIFQKKAPRYSFRETNETPSSPDSAIDTQPEGSWASNMTKGEVVAFLQELYEAELKNRKIVKELAAECDCGPGCVGSVYEALERAGAADVHRVTGISVSDIGYLLDKFGADPEVDEVHAQIRGLVDEDLRESELLEERSATQMSEEHILEILRDKRHCLIRVIDELLVYKSSKAYRERARRIPAASGSAALYDELTGKVILRSLMLNKYNITPEAFDRLTLIHEVALAENPEYDQLALEVERLTAILFGLNQERA